jgi:hypothetical protein
MAIITEYFKTRDDGVVLHRTYSDAGYMIERDGVRYSEAIDPAELSRTYIETDEPIPREYGYEPNGATKTDYQNALREMGVAL